MRIPALDGIRGLAIVLILLYHHFGLTAGWMGVDLFFVLSGFLITGILADTKHKENYYRNYIVRRILRIFPLYYFVLIVFFLIVPACMGQRATGLFAIYYHDSAYYWAYLQNWIQILHIAEYERSSRVFIHFWSLAIEEQFYIFWPLIVYFFSSRHLLRILALFIVLSISLRCYYTYAGYHWIYTYANTFARLDSLSAGAMAALMLRDEKYLPSLQKATPFLFALSFALLAGYIAVYRPHNPGDFFFRTGGYTLTALFFAGMLVYSLSTHGGNWVKLLMEMKWLRFFGKYSYALYVFHYPIICLLRPVLYERLERIFPNGLMADMLGNITCIGLAILMSLASFELIEGPALKLKMKIV